jgi:hypothetical protein
MTRRFGYWIIGTALATVSSAGCAQWGRSSASQDAAGPRFKSFLEHPFQWRGANPPVTNASAQVQQTDKNSIEGPSRGADQPSNLDTKIPGPGAVDSQVRRAPIPALKNKPASGELTEGAPVPPLMSTGEPGASATGVGKVGAGDIGLPKPPPMGPPPPVSLEVQAQAGPPIIGQAKSIRRVPLVEALDCVINNRHTEALELLHGYDRSTQEVCLRLFPILALMNQKPIDQWSPSEVAVLGEQVQGLSDLLRPRSKLVIGKACFCRIDSIKSFGIYDELPEGYAFQASTPNRPGELVHLYVELRNFAIEPKNRDFVTRLSNSIEIWDQKGVKVWGYRFEDEMICLRSPSNDYYNIYAFQVPHNLPAGTYTLKIHITDKTRPDQQPRLASRSLEFRVTSARLP